MKRILIAIAALLLLANISKAQTVETDLVGLGMNPEIAEYLAAILPGGAVLGNNTYLKARNQANDADINVLKVDATDDTVLNADTGDLVKFAIGGSVHLNLNGTNLTYNPYGDSNREFKFGAPSDTSHTLVFGDSGGTATQTFTLSASTSDADDDSTVSIAAGGAVGTTRGASIVLLGDDVGGAGVGGGITFEAGTGTAATLKFNTAGTNKATIFADGTLDFTATDVGWRAAAGANTACTTTCGANKGCLFGYDIGTTALVNCASALADSCICSTT